MAAMDGEGIGDGDDGVNSNSFGSVDGSRNNRIHTFFSGLWYEFYTSSTLLFDTRLNYLLLCGPIALVGDSLGWLGEAACFALSGLALIPCAERYVFLCLHFLYGSKAFVAMSIS